VPDPAAIEALRHSPVADLVRRCRLIAILRRVEPRERLLDLVGALAEDGVRVFEVTFDAPAATEDLVAVRERLRAAGVDDPLVGAGTIVTLERLEAAAQAGAAFIVAPTVDVEIVERAIELGLPVIPGAYSPTEIALAWRTGATFVKVFPASSLGPSHVRELRGPLPEIELIATGGVDATNARSFLVAGCVAIAAGGALVNGTPEERRAIVDAAT
jgi:2-dehydro-3-deoxyphosphogluconate aldolase / (4S)-4-hydroxy-2-oxoglutarate aldolase